MKVWTAVWLGLVLGFSSTSARADDKQPLYQLARGYEAAVEQFEKTVLSVRGIDRTDEKLVDRLDDEAAKLRLAAKNPRHFNRVFHEWRDVQKLHAQVESRIFGKYTPHHDLIYGWDVVNYRFDLFAEEFFYEVENPGHVRSVRRIQSPNSRRDHYLAPLTVPQAGSGFRNSTLPPRR